jgi:DNA-binding transcriptional ArsR family regulator
MNPLELLTGTSSILSDRVRLAIMATLAAATEPVDFKTLLESLQLTKGNLASHIRKLEDGGLITVKKAFVDRKPRTTYACTELGYQEVRTYLEKVEALLRGVSGSDS